jgi:hypothetical protein
MTLGFTQPQQKWVPETEWKIFPNRARQERKTDNLTAICELIV